MNSKNMSKNNKIKFTTQRILNIHVSYKKPFFPVFNRDVKIQTIEFQHIIKIMLPVVLPLFPILVHCFSMIFPVILQK
jgi:hypothetical protein